MLATAFSTVALAATASATLIHPNGRNDLCVHANKIAVGGKISIRTCNGKRNQQWSLPGLGNYDMVHVVINPEAAEGDRLCLQAGGLWPDFAPRNGEQASLIQCPPGWHSARFGSDWLWIPESGRFELTDFHTGIHYWLDNRDGRLESGNPVQIWESSIENVNPNQVWTLE